MAVIRWEEPPPPLPVTRERTPKVKPPFVDELIANSGRWALVATYQDSNQALSYANGINKGRAACFRPAGSFEAVYRRTEDEFRVYARHVGGRTGESSAS
jgi:hypothetical protein